MYSLYSIDSKNFNMVKVKEGKVGELRLIMNAMKNTNKSNLYAIYCGNTLVTSMLNK